MGNGRAIQNSAKPAFFTTLCVPFPTEAALLGMKRAGLTEFMGVCHFSFVPIYHGVTQHNMPYQSTMSPDTTKSGFSNITAIIGELLDSVHGHCEGSEVMNHLEKEPSLDPPTEDVRRGCKWDPCGKSEETSDMEECRGCTDGHWYCNRPELGMACYEIHRLQHHDDEGLYALYLKAQKLEAFLNAMGGDIAQVLSGE